MGRGAVYKKPIDKMGAAALRQALQRADETDARRKRQIATQAARMEGMRGTILALAGEVHDLEISAGKAARSVDEIIKEAMDAPES